MRLKKILDRKAGKQLEQGRKMMVGKQKSFEEGGGG